MTLMALIFLGILIVFTVSTKVKNSSRV